MTSGDPFGITDSVVDGRYRVERVVGQGGFGVVYRAQHLGFESPIALKVLRLPEEWSSARREARLASFQREGRMLFELSHLHSSIVRAFEMGSIRGRDGSRAPYLAIEWLDGASLDHELRSRRALGLPPLSLTAVVALLRAPAEGLARAHSKGIVHHDIKPGNLFISTRDGGEQCVKILDFGIAKLVDDSLDRNEPLSSTVTATTAFTPLYAAPEQWVETLGRTGAWTDVHALALVAVELLTGSAPFAGREPREIMTACLAQTRPTPRARGVAVAQAVDEVLARALALDPSARFPHAGAFWGALSAAAQWRDGNDSHVLELTSRRPSSGQVSSPARVTEPVPTGSTLATAPPTTRERLPPLPIAGHLAKSGAAGLAIVTAAGVLAYGIARRVPLGAEPPPLASVRARVRPAVASTGLPSRLDVRASVHASAMSSVQAVGGDVAPLSSSAHAPAQSPTLKGPSLATSRGQPRTPSLSPAAPAPAAPPARPAPAAVPGPNPPTASFALPLPDASPRHTRTSVNIDDPGLKHRK